MLCRLVGKGHNMPVPLHLETKWYIAILAQGQRGGKEFLLPLELACWGPSFFGRPRSRQRSGPMGGGGWAPEMVPVYPPCWPGLQPHRYPSAMVTGRGCLVCLNLGCVYGLPRIT